MYARVRMVGRRAAPGYKLMSMSSCLARVQVGNEFSSVEALWSQFENVMAKDPEEGKAEEGERREDGGNGEGEEEQETRAEGSERSP